MFRPVNDVERRLAAEKAGHAPRAGRLKPMGLTCELGQVLDISSSGMRVRSRSAPKLEGGEKFFVVIHAPEGLLRMMCKIIWVKKAEGRTWDVGVRFEDVDDETRATLNLTARGIAAEGYVRRHGDDTKH